MLSNDPVDTYLGVKDPGVFSSADWNFPTNLMANPGLLGRVHRGTPWQTVYLKAEAATAQQWFKQSLDFRTHPTNDWRIASLFLKLCNTNDPLNLFSVNEASETAWAGLLNGMTVLSNTPPTYFARTAPTNFDTLLIESNSPQVQIVVDGIDRTRSRGFPAYFRELDEILATPELSVASPWLNRSVEIDLSYGLTDDAYERIPEQLLPLLRTDPILSLAWINGQLHARATVFAGYRYALELSSDLQNWTAVATQSAASDTVDFTNALNMSAGKGFYRVRLITQP